MLRKVTPTTFNLVSVLFKKAAKLFKVYVKKIKMSWVYRPLKMTNTFYFLLMCPVPLVWLRNVLNNTSLTNKKET